MAQSASRDDGISLPPPPCESASSSTLRSVQLDRVAMALQQNSAADFLQQSQPSSMATTAAQHQLTARPVFTPYWWWWWWWWWLMIDDWWLMIDDDDDDDWWLMIDDWWLMIDDWWWRRRRCGFTGIIEHSCECISLTFKYFAHLILTDVALFWLSRVWMWKERS